MVISACYAAGVLLIHFSSIELFLEERHFFRFVCGSACFSLVIFALTALHLAYALVFGVVSCALICTAFYVRPVADSAIKLPDQPWSLRALFWIPLIVFGVYYFVHALGPEYSPDGSTYHLGIVGRYLRQHSFGHITTDIYANLSEGIEMLFLPAYAIGKHSAAALVEFTFLLALPWGMLSYARRVGYPKAGILGAMIVYASPVFGMSGTVAYNDVAGACILFSLFYLLQIWVQTRQHRLIPYIGLVAGFCYGAKYTLFLALPFAGLFLLWNFVRQRQPFLKPLLVYSAFALLTVVPWVAKNWMTVENPFSPFANRLFRNPYVTVSFEQEYSALMKNRDGLTLWNRPLDHIVLGGRTSGLLGPVFLLAPFALLALRFRPGRQLLLATAVFILPAVTNVETRFLMPMAPFLALALGFAFTAVPGALPAILAFHFLTAWPANMRAYTSSYAWRLTDFRPSEAFRLVPEYETLRRHMPDVAVARMLERLTPANARILAYSNPPEAYTSREIIVKYESAFGNLLGEMLWIAINPAFQPKQELSFTFNPREIKKLRVVETANHATELWTVSELHLRNEGADLPREKEWSLASSVNHWDLPLAFDRNPVTRWSTVENIHAGMFLEVDLGRPRRISSVALDSVPEWAPRLQLQVQQEPGKWIVLSSSPVIRGREAEPTLRSHATAALKAYGITHLLIGPDDFGKDDFYANSGAWRMDLAGEAQGSRLYKLL